MIKKSLNGTEYEPVSIEGVTSLTFRDFIKTPRNQLPSFINARNCIYIWTNLVNNKVYVGKSSWLYGRTYKDWTSHYNELLDPYDETYLNRAVRKYKPKNFIIELLEINCEDPWEREIYWISRFNPNLDKEIGYNLTPGGYSTIQMNTPEGKRKAVERRIEIYGSPWGAANTPESHALSGYNAALTNMFNRGILPRLNLVKSSDRLERVKEYIAAKPMNIWHHLPNIFYWIEDLKLDPRWTTEINLIFHDIYEYCSLNYPDWTKDNLAEVNPIIL